MKTKSTAKKFKIIKKEELKKIANIMEIYRLKEEVRSYKKQIQIIKESCQKWQEQANKVNRILESQQSEPKEEERDEPCPDKFGFDLS